MAEENKKKEEKLVKKPNALVYSVGGFFFDKYIKLRFNVKVTGEKPVGPAIILSNHTSNQDYKFILNATYPRRVTFIATYHWFTFRVLGFGLRLMGAIPKYQFSMDMGCMKKIRYALDKNNALVFIAPEGTIYAGGKLGYISPSIAKTIKIFGKPVYASRIQGAGLGNAKWSRKAHRSEVSIDTHLIISKEETKSLTVDEIMERITTSLQYDEFQFQKEHNVLLSAPDKLDGFDTMFYKCPHCGKEFGLKASGNEVECTCGAKAVLGDDFRFTWNTEKQYFDNYSEWYEWQLEEVKKEILTPGWKLEEEMDYGIDQDGVNNYIKVGKGKLTFSRDGWDYKGTFQGEEIEEHDDVKDVFLATLKVGLHIELPHRNGHCRVFYPVENGNTSMKWHLASRAMSELIEEKRI